MRYAQIHASTGKIQNVIELPDDYDKDAPDAWTPPGGSRVEPDPQARAQVGGYYRNGTWEAPEIVAPPADADIAKADAAEARLAELATKGWDNLTAAEKGEVAQRALESIGLRRKARA